MVVGPDFTRRLKTADHDEVNRLLEMVFGGTDEVQLVHELRKEGAMAEEIIKPWGGKIAGYCAVSWMIEPKGWACLAPVAVRPDMQRGCLDPLGQPKVPWRVGTRMVQELTQYIGLPLKDAPIAIVALGDPSFYERCGFSRLSASQLNSPYPVEHTMVAGRIDAPPMLTLKYPKAFDLI